MSLIPIMRNRVSKLSNCEQTAICLIDTLAVHVETSDHDIDARRIEDASRELHQLYWVTDPSSGKEYYTTKVEDTGKGGAVKMKDAKTESMVTLQSSEVKEISEE